MSSLRTAPGVVLPVHDTDYCVYAAADNCGHPRPEDDTSDEYAAWEDDHPGGEGVSGWEGEICYLTPMGVWCKECSDDQGDWTRHIFYCTECTYAGPDCQCEPNEED